MDISILSEINEWWVRGRVNESFLEPVERNITSEILQVMDERQIILLEGPRRVGKTSIMFHIIQRLLEKKNPPRHILYVSLDDPLISKENFFEALISIIENNLIRERIQAAKFKIYLFLDEITHLKDWEFYLKRYYDRKYPIKFIVSSSAASFLAKKSRESLVGRIFRFGISPFSFAEFLKLISANEEMVERQKRLAIHWEDFFSEPDAEVLYKNLQRTSKDMAFDLKNLEINLYQFLLNGGFPEFLQLRSERAVRQYFPENVIERVVYHDIPETFSIDDRGLLESLLLYSIFHSGSIININEISSSYHATRQTVSGYLYYLQASMLIRLLEKYAKTKASRLRAFRKLYTIDAGLYTHLQRLTPVQIEQRGLQGQLAEIAVFSMLNSYTKLSERIFYYREREAEVDFVVETVKCPVPIEVKYRTAPEEIKGIRHFTERFNSRAAVVITKDMLMLEGKVLFVPLRLFLS